MKKLLTVVTFIFMSVVSLCAWDLEYEKDSQGRETNTKRAVCYAEPIGYTGALVVYPSGMYIVAKDNIKIDKKLEVGSKVHFTFDTGESLTWAGVVEDNRIAIVTTKKYPIMREKFDFIVDQIKKSNSMIVTIDTIVGRRTMYIRNEKSRVILNSL